jgi:hypothetical protein
MVKAYNENSEVMLGAEKELRLRDISGYTMRYERTVSQT